MNREEAMDKATEIVEKMGNSPDLNNRGYKVDGWKPPTLGERTVSVVQIAEFLLGPQFGTIDPVPGPMRTTVCETCGGSIRWLPHSGWGHTEPVRNVDHSPTLGGRPTDPDDFVTGPDPRDAPPGY